MHLWFNVRPLARAGDFFCETAKKAASTDDDVMLYDDETTEDADAETTEEKCNY